MGMVNVFGARAKHDVMADTWGHLYPEPGSKHRGKILIMHHGSDTIMLEREFPTLQQSPIEYELVCTATELYEWTDGLHELECTLWFYKSCGEMYLGSAIGRIIKPKVKTLYSTATWGM